MILKVGYITKKEQPKQKHTFTLFAQRISIYMYVPSVQFSSPGDISDTVSIWY